jgi:hypothetical protein
MSIHDSAYFVTLNNLSAIPAAINCRIIEKASRIFSIANWFSRPKVVRFEQRILNFEDKVGDLPCLSTSPCPIAVNLRDLLIDFLIYGDSSATK